MPESYEVRPIGFVRSGLRSVADAPNQARGAPEAVLDLDPDYADALLRVEPGQDLILLTWLHLADREVRQVHPTGDPGIPLTGVFGTRSPGRPNPIGLHRVRVTEIVPPARLRVHALEVVDGTPVLDLKVVLDPSRDG
ncbi:MAG: tRNA (N6-threonylcarbamoyladenosine(37)-N6)-methyltransferase TrmO [Streptosporangiales bacterium]|nr:tRNA (N6-threonylcarbamoyladenosine(37)-N6)-methyltransferase TrmO [Streptosporangiales bacterium]MBO0890262.1 tRNA (N6-threonylcarbamoyladenosine(37)-N6)-methyltransferase TrmO [Acidothermales bacterium]